jgi:hypothetical protein
MQSLTHTLNRSVPRLDQIRMRQGLFPTAEDFRSLFVSQFFVFSVLKQFAVVFVDPSRELPSFVDRKGAD